MRTQIYTIHNKTSGRLDLNQRPLEPHSSALPGCATPRFNTNYPIIVSQFSGKVKKISLIQVFDLQRKYGRTSNSVGVLPVVNKAGFLL